MPDRLKELMDREDISFLLNEYCRALDLMDLEAIAGVFTEDCVVDYGPEERLKSHGANGLADDLRRMWRYSRTSHHLSNIQITFEDEDHAASVSYVIAWHERPDESTGLMLGQYHDKLVRTASGWRIQYRKLVMSGNDKGFPVNIHRLARIAAPEGWSWVATGDSLK